LLAGEDKNYEPEWTYRPQARAVLKGNGEQLAVGAPVATWRWGGLRFAQRELLRAFIIGLSEQVYIRTATNETLAGAQVFDDYLCNAHWTAGSELTGVNYVEQVVIEFTNLEAI
jgi:hypothetical protein